MTHHQSMTSAEFSARYQLLKPVADGKVRTLNALATASGKVVMVHYLVGTTDENNAMLARVRALPETERLKLIETLDVEGHPVVVTQFLQGFESLDVWMSSHTPGGAAKQIKVRMRRPDEPQPRSGSTQPIRAGGAGAGKVAPPPPPPPPVAPPPAAARATGSMTQPIATPKAPPAPPPAPPVVPPPPPPPAPATQGGEFTRLFNSMTGNPASAQPAVPSPQPPPAPPVTPPPAPPRPATPPASVGPAPSPPPAAAPGEFTQIFQRGGLPSGPDRPAPSGPL